MTLRLIIAVVALCYGVSAWSWWHEDWKFRKVIYLDTADIGLSQDATLTDVPVLVRLHLGNFAYFMDVAAQGSDLRFVAADDVTPLEYRIQQLDTIAGIGLVWLKIPSLTANGEPTRLYMYYGNGQARSAESQQFWPAEQVLALGFDETTGRPSDSTAFGHHPAQSTLALGQPGQLGSSAALNGSNFLRIAATPLNAVTPQGFTVTAWLKPGPAVVQGTLYRQGPLEVDVDRGFPVARFAGFEARSDRPLQEGRWHHVALVLETSSLRLVIDGETVASTAIDAGESGVVDGQEIRIGAAEPEAAEVGDGPSVTGFIGALDELRITRRALSNAQLQFFAVSQREDNKLVSLGEDESQQSASGEYFALIWKMLDAVRLEGWVIIAIIVILGLASFDVLITKSFQLRRAERSDEAFLERFSQAERVDSLDAGDHAGPIAELYRAFADELKALGSHFAGSGNSGAALEALRATLDANLVEATEKLNQRVVLITMAVSGGPFLGLLGTVVGVMITFAAISAAGDVNVRTIAPGVAAALTTTVLGLAVAIPSLFGYNHLAGRISRRVAAMEVFADQLISRAGLGLVGPATSSEPSR